MAREIIFSDSIVKEHIDDIQLDKAILNCLEDEKRKGSGVVKTNRGGFQTNDIKDDYITNALVNYIGKALINNFKIHSKKIILTNSWINENNKGDYNEVHTHPNCDFAGVYYVKVPKNSGNLRFYRSDTSASWSKKVLHMSDTDAWTEYTLKPEGNLLILFPGNLLHYVEPSMSDEPRVSIACNVILGEE